MALSALSTGISAIYYLLRERVFQDLACLRILHIVRTGYRRLSVVGRTSGMTKVSFSFIPRVVSISFAYRGWSDAPESGSRPEMPTVIQFVGIFLKAVLGWQESGGN